MKRYASLFLSLALLLTFISKGLLCINANAVTSASGTCGTSVNWALDTDGTLTISGTGQMTDFTSYTKLPWYELKDSIENVVIENGVTSIGRYSFYGCTNLTSVAIPDSIFTIGYFAFAACTSLTSITIPDSVVSVSQTTFQGCNAMTGIWVDDNNQNYASDSAGVLFDKNKTTLIKAPGAISGEYVIANNVTSIGDSAFARCTSLTSITIPDSVTSIGDFAFSDCTSLTGIEIPDSVTSIGSAAFQYCTSLTNIAISNSVTKIDTSTFQYCTNLSSITIPTSVTKIGNSAFDSCDKLETVYFEGSQSQWNAITIGEYRNTAIVNANIVFAVCEYVNGCCACGKGDPAVYNYIVTSDMAFITGVEKSISGAITIPSALGGYPVVQILGSAFSQCYNITSVTIPNTITLIGDYTFLSCTSLTDITIPDSITSIGKQAFGNCTSLISVIIPNSVSSIRDTTFHGCSSLTSITIPDSVTSIGQFAFGGCSNLTDVYYNGTVARWEQINIGSNNTYLLNATLHTIASEVSFDEKVYHNLRLQDLTKIGYAFEITTNDVVDEYGVLIWTGNADDEVTVGMAGVQNKVLTYDNGFYVAESDGIYAQRLDVIYYAKPYVKIGDQYVYGSVDTYSPLTYAQTVLNGSDEKLKQLMIDLLNYGAYAQLYFAESNKEAAPEVLVNDILTEEQKVMNWRDGLKVATPTVTKDTANTLETKWYGTNLNLLEAIQMNMAATGDIVGMYYWTEESYNNAEILDSASASGEAKIRTDGSYTIGGLTGIVAQSVSDVYYVCGYDESGNLGAIRADSVAAYATRLMESTTSTEATVNMAKALLVYGNSAMNYFTQTN